MKYSPQQNRKNEGKRRKQWSSFSGVWSVAWQKMPLFAFVLQRRSEIPPYTGLFLLLLELPKVPLFPPCAIIWRRAKAEGFVQHLQLSLIIIIFGTFVPKASLFPRAADPKIRILNHHLPTARLCPKDPSSRSRYPLGGFDPGPPSSQFMEARTLPTELPGLG